MRIHTRVLSASVAALVAFSGVSAFADDADRAARAKLKEAEALYAERENLAKNDAAIRLLEEAEKLATDPDTKYDVLILASRAIYWKGNHARTDEEKLVIFEQGIAKAAAAKALNDDYAEAYYYYAINLGKWALAKGVLASLFRKKELMQHAQGALDRDTRDGRAGETLDGYGPDRVLGRMYFKLPGFAGGSRDESLKHLEKAWRGAKNYAVNVSYYAETLYEGDSSQRHLAKVLLDDLLKSDPNTFNPARTPETKEEFEDARVLRRQMGN